MAHPVSHTLGLCRLGALWLALALGATGCGSVGVTPSSTLSTGGTSGPSSDSGGGTSGTPTSGSGPVISGTPAAKALAGENYTFTPEAADPDGAALSFEAANLPPWARFDSNTG